MYFLFDTNILLAYVRGNARITDEVESTLSMLGAANPTILYSIVSRGELLSLGLQLHWTNNKKAATQAVLKQFLQVDINSADLIEEYALIDAYSQGKLAGSPLPFKMAARNMGKNDLWIAATASVTGAILVTTDNDFNHLRSFGISILNFSYLLKPSKHSPIKLLPPKP